MHSITLVALINCLILAVPLVLSEYGGFHHQTSKPGLASVHATPSSNQKAAVHRPTASLKEPSSAAAHDAPKVDSAFATPAPPSDAAAVAVDEGSKSADTNAPDLQAEPNPMLAPTHVVTPATNEAGPDTFAEAQQNPVYEPMPVAVPSPSTASFPKPVFSAVGELGLPMGVAMALPAEGSGDNATTTPAIPTGNVTAHPGHFI